MDFNKLSLESANQVKEYYSEIYLCSNGRSDGDNNKPTFNLDYSVQEVKKIQVAEVEVPITWYLFDSNHNSITIQEGVLTATATIPVGNYNSTTIISALKTALDSASPLGQTYTVSISSLTSKMTISSTGNFSIVSGTINTLLGLPSSSSSAASVIGSNVVQLNYPNFIHLRSNLGSLAPYSANIDDNNLSNNILARIPIDKSYGEVVFYKPFLDKNNYFTIDSYIQSINYLFTYPDPNYPNDTSKDIQIDFNGAETSMKIKIFFTK